MQIVPALLTHTTAEFEEQLLRLLPFYKRFSIDIQDGKLVPSSTITTQEVLTILQNKRTQLVNVTFDFDLMLENFNDSLQKLEISRRNINIGNVLINYKALKGAPIPSQYKLNIGLSLEPSDTIEEINRQYNLQYISSVQIMTIHAGPQGQAFMPEMLQKIGNLRQLNYRNSIYIDGGVKLIVLSDITNLDYKPDFVCVGSYFSQAKNEELQEKVNAIEAALNHQ